MKHLRKFNESMADLASDSYRKRQECLNYLKDISLDLVDNNFNVEVSSEVLSRDDKYISVVIKKRPKTTATNPLGSYGATRFDYNEVKYTLLSMISYMNSEDYSVLRIEVSDKYVHNLIPVELKDEDLYFKWKKGQIDYPIGQLSVWFSKNS